jgi:hypothetical protein
LEKHVVVAKLTVQESEKNKHLENPGGPEVLQRLGGQNAGLPFFAFTDARGEMIVNARRPDGRNIGHPFAPEEIDWFLKMLERAAPKMSGDERKTIETWLRNQKR